MEDRNLSLSTVAGTLGVSERTVRRWIKSGKLRAYRPGRDYRIPESAVRELVEESEISPKAQSSSLELALFNGADDKRHADWSNAVEEAQRLREPGRAQMGRALSEWAASKKRGAPYATRREYLDEMGNLLQEAYGAYTTLGNAYIEAALTQGGNEASVPSHLQQETVKAHDFYVELFGMVSRARLTISLGDAAAKRAGKARPEVVRPHAVEEPKAA